MYLTSSKYFQSAEVMGRRNTNSQPAQSPARWAKFCKNFTMIKVTCLSFILSFSFCFGQATLNLELKSKLDSIQGFDQKFRVLSYGFQFQNKKDSIQKILNLPQDKVLNYLDSLTNYYDSINLISIEKIIDIYGYPGLSLVGEPTNKVAWYVIQHSPNKISKYLRIIKKAAVSNELPFKLYAMLEDRHLMIQKGKKQTYGSQLTSVGGNENGNFDASKAKFIVWTIKNYKTVNRRRKFAGFSDTIEDYCKLFNIEYKHYTLRQIKKMRLQ
jgi:hypothetical protein